MQTIKAILIDDELSSLQNLQHKLKEFCPNVSVIASTQKPEEAIELIRMHNPDVVFLDIEMPRMSGFRMLEKLGDAQPEIIFTTAYNHYAIDAIRISAFDYLTKPIAIADLQNAVSRLQERDQNRQTKERLDLLRHTVDDVQKTNDKIAVPTSDGIEFLQIKDILRIESSGNYCHICFVNGKKTVVTKLLKDFEEMLLPYRFFRIHHSHLINLDYIKKYIRGEGGQVLMQNEDLVDVSRRKKEEFLKMLSA
ncbi:MAG: LytTR family DNA-binding domain-containing protein [Ferruginibacter sp.]